MAAKKAKKTTKRHKKLGKAKKLAANKPLYSFGASNPAMKH
jgi:hypothetical protein